MRVSTLLSFAISKTKFLKYFRQALHKKKLCYLRFDKSSCIANLLNVLFCRLRHEAFHTQFVFFNLASSSLLFEHKVCKHHKKWWSVPLKAGIIECMGLSVSVRLRDHSAKLAGTIYDVYHLQRLILKLGCKEFTPSYYDHFIPYIQTHIDTECLLHSLNSRYASAAMHSSFLFVATILFIIIYRFFTTYNNTFTSKYDTVIIDSLHFILKIRRYEQEHVPHEQSGVQNKFKFWISIIVFEAYLLWVHSTYTQFYLVNPDRNDADDWITRWKI